MLVGALAGNEAVYGHIIRWIYKADVGLAAVSDNVDKGRIQRVAAADAVTSANPDVAYCGYGLIGDWWYVLTAVADVSFRQVEVEESIDFGDVKTG